MYHWKCKFVETFSKLTRNIFFWSSQASILTNLFQNPSKFWHVQWPSNINCWTFCLPMISQNPFPQIGADPWKCVISPLNLWIVPLQTPQSAARISAHRQLLVGACAPPRDAWSPVFLQRPMHSKWAKRSASFQFRLAGLKNACQALWPWPFSLRTRDTLGHKYKNSFSGNCPPAW